ncbi:MAG: PKD domain-containing protein, partial [Chitinophagales bacterium]|nr:PKD domain-containing protein [Chitinophagales bacterium]
MKSKSFYHIYLILLCLLGNHFLLSAQDDPCLNFSSSFTLNTQPNSLEVSFNNQSTGDYLGGTWYFGDGTDAPANVNPILHTYPSTGYYQVCLEIYSIWCYSQTCKWVRVPNDIPTCTADFSYQPNPNNPLVINFTDNSSFQFLNGNTAPSYIWNFGDDNTANTPNPTHQYTESGIYDVCLYIINNETACNDTICYPIPVAVPNCTAGFAYEQNVVNGSPTIIFTNQSTYLDNLGTANYLWEFDDSTTSTDTNPTHSFPAGQYEVCLTINVLDNAGGSVCTDSTCQTITINDCTAAFQYTSNNEGLATFSDFSTSTAGNITAWSWDFGDGGAATAQNPTHQYTESGTYSVCLTISTDQDCTDTYCEDVPITINTCQANFTYAPNGANIVFTNASTASGGFVSYEWQFGDGTFSTATNTSHIYAEGEYQVCLTITTTTATNNTVLCTDSTCQTIIVGCNANFEANVNESGLANFTDQSTTTIGNIVAWAWDFGNGNTSNLSNPSIQYIEAGDYNVCLTITTDTQCSDDICQIITINLPECQPQFTYTINYNNDNEVVFTNLSPTPPNSVNVSYFWDLGDGSNSSETNPTHFYGTDTYQVCLTTTYSVTFNNDFVSVCTDSTCQTITIGSCAAAFQYTTTNTGFTSFSDFSTSTAGNITAWSWDFGDGGAATTQNPTHQYSENGTYLVCLDITTAEGCTSQYCENISITIANCNAEFSSNLTATGLANFTDQSTSNGTIIAWDWVFDNGLSSETQNPSTQYTQDGNYNVCLTINDSNECSDTHCENVPVDIPNCNALFDANIFFSNGIAGVTLTNNTIIAPAPTNTTFFWDLGDGTTSNIPSPTHTYPSGTYQICLTVNYAVPFANDLVTICSDSTCQTITIGSCNANFTGNSNFAGIANFTDQSTSTAGTITAWSWIFGDGTSGNTQNPTHQYTASGTYNVCLAITTNTGCSDSFCSDITVNVPTCNADMTVNIGTAALGIFTTNTSTHSPATLPVDYLWEFGDGTTSTAFAPSHSYTTGGTYEVCLTQNVMSGNNLVCSDSTCQTITLGSCNANFT